MLKNKIQKIEVIKWGVLSLRKELSNKELFIAIEMFIEGIYYN